MNLRLLVTLICVTFGFSTLHAADLSGKWTSQFDSQIGPQKYTYEFKTDAGKITGKAAYDHSIGKGESQLSEIKVEKDDVSFTETVHLNDTDLRITYSGKISDDEMKLTRKVADIATYQIVVKRAKAETKPEVKPEAKTPATK